MLIPDSRLIKSLLAFLLLGLTLAFLEIFGVSVELMLPLWWWAFSLFIVMVCFDPWISRSRLAVDCSRQIASSFALGADTKVRLNFENPSFEDIHIQVIDNYAEELVADKSPQQINLAAKHETAVDYDVLPVKRGETEFGKTSLRIQTRMKFWRFSVKRGREQAVKVYPNFMAVSNLNFLVYEQQLNHIGAHATQRRGQGLDFKQLREFQRGDELRQVDWKASARQHKLISREYQDERDQDIIFMLDTGRRMRASDGLLSHFDHCVNAMLLTSYVALLAGDAVGFMSYAGTDRWLSPIKGKTSINQILNQLYDLHSTTDASDLLKASEKLMLRHRKRSLIIVVTNIRDEDGADVIRAVRLLSKKHVVMVACLRESILNQPALAEQTDFDDALEYSGIQLYLEKRKKLIGALEHAGVICADATADGMHIALINQYMALKRAGQI